MFEQYDFDTILSRMMSNVSDSLDKREGSVIYDALSPMAAELAQAYIVIDDIIDLIFPDTSVGLPVLVRV